LAARLLSLGALVLVVAACGAEAVPEESSSADTARVETVTRVSGPDGDQEIRSSGVLDYAHDRSSYVQPTTGCRSITIGEVSYSEVPREAGMPGKRWVKNGWDLADAEAQFEASQKPQADDDGWTGYAFSFAFPTPSPAEYLAYLREHGELERSGEGQVRGVPTTRYRTTLDQKQLTREQLEHEGWKDANIEQYLKTLPETTEEVEIWVDAADLARRVVTTSTTNAEIGGSHRSVTTSEYFDFGVAPAIEAPPAAEVIEWEGWEQQEKQSESSVAPSCLH
jgi:hypothetical protein